MDSLNKNIMNQQIASSHTRAEIQNLQSGLTSNPTKITISSNQISVPQNLTYTDTKPVVILSRGPAVRAQSVQALAQLSKEQPSSLDTPVFVQSDFKTHKGSSEALVNHFSAHKPAPISSTGSSHTPVSNNQISYSSEGVKITSGKSLEINRYHTQQHHQPEVHYSINKNPSSHQLQTSYSTSAIRHLPAQNWTTTTTKPSQSETTVQKDKIVIADLEKLVTNIEFLNVPSRIDRNRNIKPIIISSVSRAL